MPGDVIAGRFCIEKCIGGGGQGLGFLASDPQAPPFKPWEANVFVKQYHAAVPSPAIVNRLGDHFDKLRTRLEQSDGAYLCLPTHLFTSHGSIITVSPWVQGSDLSQLMDPGLTQEQCVRFAHAITKVIRDLHSVNVAYLDLKPENVRIQSTHRGEFVRLIDLDASQINGESAFDQVVGTEWYMSPEHFAPNDFGPVSRKSDVYTLGIMLFELLLKQHPFADARDYKEAAACGAFIVPESTASDYDSEVVDTIIDCLSVNASDRPTAKDVFRILCENRQMEYQPEIPVLRWSPKASASRRSKRNENQTALPVNAVKLSLLGPTRFERVYDKGTTIGRTELRGCGIGILPSEVLELKIIDTGVWCRLLVQFRVWVNGLALDVGEDRRLQDGDLLRIAGVTLRVTIFPRRY